MIDLPDIVKDVAEVARLQAHLDSGVDPDSIRRLTVPVLDRLAGWAGDDPERRESLAAALNPAPVIPVSQQGDLEQIQVLSSVARALERSLRGG